MRRRMERPLIDQLRANLGRAILISLIVGSALVMINHGDHIEQEPVCTHFWAKAGLCYLVPFMVSMGSVWLAIRARRKRR